VVNLPYNITYPVDIAFPAGFNSVLASKSVFLAVKDLFSITAAPLASTGGAAVCAQPAHDDMRETY
jgi:hypothetical protein